MGYYVAPTFDIIYDEYSITGICGGIHPGRVEPAPPMELTTSRIQARRSYASSTLYLGVLKRSQKRVETDIAQHPSCGRLSSNPVLKILPSNEWSRGSSD